MQLENEKQIKKQNKIERAANGYKESPENIADSFNEIVLGI